MVAEVDQAEYLDEIRKEVFTAASSVLRAARHVRRWARRAGSSCTCRH